MGWEHPFQAETILLFAGVHAGHGGPRRAQQAGPEGCRVAALAGGQHPRRQAAERAGHRARQGPHAAQRPRPARRHRSVRATGRCSQCATCSK